MNQKTSAKCYLIADTINRSMIEQVSFEQLLLSSLSSERRQQCKKGEMATRLEWSCESIYVVEKKCRKIGRRM